MTEPLTLLRVWGDFPTLRLCSDVVDREIDGETYSSFPFMIDLPQDPDAPPRLLIPPIGLRLPWPETPPQGEAELRIDGEPFAVWRFTLELDDAGSIILTNMEAR